MEPLFKKPDRPSTAAHEEAVAFWYGLINYEQRPPDPADLKLDRMKQLLSVLGNPHERLRIIHIAGSKGKGSTSAMIASICTAAGRRTGLFTSPHLHHVEERFRIDGQPIAPGQLAEILLEIRDAILANGLGRPTFFEVATAACFLHFQRSATDVAILEVGLGGRLDSTNVCSPMTTAITSISLDHVKQLGSTLDSIAREKAGIIKPGIPIVSGAPEPEPAAAIAEIANARNAPLYLLGTDFGYDYTPGSLRQPERQSIVNVWMGRQAWSGMRLALLGEHQARNAAVALATCKLASDAGLKLPEEAYREGLRQATWPGRLEILGRNPTVIADCAHNPASATALVQALAHDFSGIKRHLIFAASSDKDYRGMLRILSPFFQQVYATRYLLNPRAVALEDLQLELIEAGSVGARCFPHPNDAWHFARQTASPDDLVVVAGSVFLVGELRPLILATAHS